MSILLTFLVLAACVASAAGGAFGMRWWAERKREIADREDPRDTEIRDLQARLKVAQDDAGHSAQTFEGAREHLDLAHARIGELLAGIQAANQKYLTCKNVLKNEIQQKNELRDQLNAIRFQHETLKQRTQELEIELSLQDTPDNPLEAARQDTPEQPDEEEAGFPALPVAEVGDDHPSLIQSLTEELERWRRHCRVLGDELKQRRNLSARGPDSGTPADELTAIRGIGSVMERELHELGIYRYRDLAAIETGDKSHPLLEAPRLRARMLRYAWAEQARELHRRKYRESL